MISFAVEQEKVKEAMNPVTSHIEQQINGTQENVYEDFIIGDNKPCNCYLDKFLSICVLKTQFVDEVNGH